MAGSITEAILYDLIVKDLARLARAQSEPRWPKRSGTPKKVDELNLEDLIKLGTLTGLIDNNDEETFDRVLRNYRKFVHPTRELKDEANGTEGRAFMAKGALDTLRETLSRKS